MTATYDEVFQKAMCDHWWVPDCVDIVNSKEMEMLHCMQDRRLFNAVVRVSPDLDDYTELVEEVMATHRGRGSEWRIGAPSHSPKLERTVLNAGYQIDGMADAWSIGVKAPRPPAPDDIVVSQVIDIQGIRDMHSLMDASFTKRKCRSEEALQEDLAGCTGRAPRCLRFVAYDKKSGQPLSTGALNLFPNLGLGFMWGGCTIPSARGRGIYSAMVTRRMEIAREKGMQRLGLYAMRETSGPIVQAQGFDKHGPMYFWGRDATP